MPIKFKTDQVRLRFSLVHPTLQTMCLSMADFCDKRGKDFTLTETMTSEAEDRALNRVSDSHNQGRAVDIRTVVWDKQFIDLFISSMTDRFDTLGAYSGDGTRKLLVYHDSGHGMHIHCQLDTRYTVETRIK